MTTLHTNTSHAHSSGPDATRRCDKHRCNQQLPGDNFLSWFSLAATWDLSRSFHNVGACLCTMHTPTHARTPRIVRKLRSRRTWASTNSYSKACMFTPLRPPRTEAAGSEGTFAGPVTNKGGRHADDNNVASSHRKSHNARRWQLCQFGLLLRRGLRLRLRLRLRVRHPHCQREQTKNSVDNQLQRGRCS